MNPIMTVPIEPTEAMLQDGARAYEAFMDRVASPYGHMHQDAMREAWTAMLKIAYSSLSTNSSEPK